MPKVAVIRHGEKDGDRLTPKGAAEIFAITELLVKKKGINIGSSPRFICSGTLRTYQSAQIGFAAADIAGEEGKIIQKENFHFLRPFNQFLHGSMEELKAELAVINENGGTVAAALKISEYARCARELISIGIKEASFDHRGVDTIAYSHGEYLNLAVPMHQAAEIPYSIGSGSSVIYTVRSYEIISAEYVPNPLATQ
jgi:hypothetical protein